MAKKKMTVEKFTLKNVTLVYAPGLFEKSALNEGDEEKYSTKFIIDPKKNRKNLEALEDLMDDLKEEEYGPGKVRNLLSTCLKDGEDMEDEIFHGKMVFVASSKKRPVCVDEENEIVTQEDDVLYSGCKVDATVNVWAMNHEKYGKRMVGQLRAVRFVGDGDPIGGGSIDPETEFED